MERHRSTSGLAAIVSVAALFASLAPASAEAQTSRSTAAPRPPARCVPVDTKLVGAPYALEHGLSGADLQSKYFGASADPDDGSFNDQGFRPVRLTGYVDDGSVRFATKWVRDGGPSWNSRAGLTGAQFHARSLTLPGDGYFLL